MSARARSTSRVSRLARSAAAPARQGHQRQSGAPVLPGSRMLGSARPQVRVGAPSTPLGQSSLGDRDQARAAGAGRDLGIPAAVADDLLKGHLSQHCPDCGITEAAGGYCTKCDRRTGPADWFRQTRGRPVSGPQKTPENGLKRGPGRPRGHVDAGALVTRPTAGPNARLVAA